MKQYAINKSYSIYETERYKLIDDLKKKLYENNINNEETNEIAKKIRELNQKEKDEINKKTDPTINKLNKTDKEYLFFKDNVIENYKYLSPYLDIQIVSYLNNLYNDFSKDNQNKRDLDLFIQLYEEHSNRNNEPLEILLLKSYESINHKLQIILKILSKNFQKSLKPNEFDEIIKHFLNLIMPRILFEDLKIAELPLFFKFLSSIYNNNTEEISYVWINKKKELVFQNKINEEKKELIEIDDPQYLQEIINNPKSLFSHNLFYFIKRITENKCLYIENFSLLYLSIKYAMEFIVDEDGKIDLFRYQNKELNNYEKKEKEITLNNIYAFIKSIYNHCNDESSKNIGIINHQIIPYFKECCYIIAINKALKTEPNIIDIDLKTKLKNIKNTITLFKELLNKFNMQSFVIIEINQILNNANFIQKDIPNYKELKKESDQFKLEKNILYNQFYEYFKDY
jgi:hypothetical protein